jgi:hypothetical protein
MACHQADAAQKRAPVPVRPQHFFSYSIARTRPAAVARSCLLPFLIIHTLALVYDRFTEGFETADLKLARAA